MIEFNDYFKSVLNEIKYFDFFVAGGSISALHYHIRVDQDLDIYFRTEEDFNKLNMYFEQNYSKVSSTINAVTYYDNKKFDMAQEKITIQLIRKNFGTPEEILDGFDINKSMVALDIKNKNLVYDPRFYEPLHATRFNKDTLKRLAKYSDRVKERVDWFELISKYMSGFELEDYYGGTDVDSVKNIKLFFKNYLVTLYSKSVQNDISLAIEKFSFDAEWLNFLSTVFVPWDLDTDIYIVGVLYYKYFKTYNFEIENIIKEKAINTLLQKYGNQIKLRNPEYLF